MIRALLLVLLPLIFDKLPFVTSDWTAQALRSVRPVMRAKLRAETITTAWEILALAQKGQAANININLYYIYIYTHTRVSVYTYIYTHHYRHILCIYIYVHIYTFFWKDFRSSSRR